MPETSSARPARPFKSAEKPVSLYPLSFKQAVVALLQVGPIANESPAEAEALDGQGRPDRSGR